MFFASFYEIGRTPLVEWVRSMAPRVRRMRRFVAARSSWRPRPLESPARDDALDVFRAPRDGIPVDSGRFQPPLRSRREYLLFGRGHRGDRSRLALVEEDLGREITLAVARMMVAFPWRPGGQSQFSVYVSLLETKNRPDIGELQAWILGTRGTISAHPPSRIAWP
jgi:hypothetical protein